MKLSKKFNIAIVGGIMAIGLLTSKVSASQIEIKPNQIGIRSVTVSQSYVTCRNLDNVNSTLGTTELDPHLVTNKDWGAVAYLANSDYGVGADGHTTARNSGQGLSGKQIEVDGIKYFSTSGNATGIMNWGANPNGTTYTHTSSLGKNLNSMEQISSEETKNNLKSLVNNIGSRYVERVDTNNTMGMAITETNGWGSPNWFGSDITYTPVSIRSGLFGYWMGYSYNFGAVQRGGASTNTTFRPVIWNIN